MALLRRTFVGGRLETDLDERLVPDGFYTYAENIVVVDSEGPNAGAVENSLSNKQLTNISFGENPIVLGSYANESIQKLYWFIKSDIGCYIVEYDEINEVAVKILEDTRPLLDRVLNFNENFLITAVDMVLSEDFKKKLLIISDDNLQPLCINVDRAKTYGPNGFEKEDIYLIKKPPRFAPKAQPTLVAGTSNFIEEQFLSFSYAYKYLDGEYSALSSYANYVFFPEEFKLDYEVNDNIGMLNAFNAVRVTINTGDKRVTDVECVVKASNSNNLYIVETFNKEEQGWGDNVDVSFVFYNNKIYINLPQNEISRASDNVPYKAKALVVIGNRIVFGNYVEGFNLIDQSGVKVKPNFQLSIIQSSLEGSSIPFTLGSSTYANDLLGIDLTGLSLIEGSKLTLFISLKNDQVPARRFDDDFSFVLNKNFADASELAQDPDFIFFIEEYMTNIFMTNYNINAIDNSILLSNTTFTINNFSTTSIAIKTPELVFQIDDTPNDITDNPANTHPLTIHWGNESDSSVLFYQIGSVASLKSNRSLEVGLIYLDEFNRATSVITQLNNTIYIPHDFAIYRNRLKLKIFSNAPANADRYKIVVKTPALDYQTIYVTTFYVDGLFRWCKLEGDNKDKIKVGDLLIFKADTQGFMPTLIQAKVLEIKDQEKDFIKSNLDDNNKEIIERQGLYFKIKAPAGISMNYIPDSLSEFHGSTSSKGDDFTMYVGPLVDSEGADITIKQGSRIEINLDNVKYGSSGGHEIFNKVYFASADYDNFQDWYANEVNGTAPFVKQQNGVYRIQGKLYLLTGNQLNGNGQHKSYMSGSVKILVNNSLIILETAPKKSITQEIYYESEQTFEIINGMHQGNLANQTNLLPAEIDLNFFNCYCQGNGAESYIIRDGFNKNSLNIDLRPTATQIEQFKAIRRYADLTYSEAFIESSSLNRLNVFNTATANYKELDKQNGSIQKLLSRDNDLIILKERKASKVLFQKDVLYGADGNPNITGTNQVLGQEITYLGSNGCGKHPEGVAANNFQIYYPNPEQGVITRLSIDGTTPIVQGMKNFFKEIFKTQPNARMLGGYDPHKDHYVYSVGDEPEKILLLNCGNEIIKENQIGIFSYNLELNDLSGDIVLNYNITSGNATIEAVFDSISHVVSNVTGLGNITFARTTLNEKIVNVTITQAGTAQLNYQISNICPIGLPLTIVSIVVNGADDIGKNIINKTKWGPSVLYSTEEEFTQQPVSKFLTENGLEGVGKFPLNGSVFTIQSFKDASTSGAFSLSECNRLGYLITNTVYTSADINTILASATFLSITTITDDGFNETNLGNFLFNRANTNEKLYLIWDYNNNQPIVSDDSASVLLAGNVIINVLANDQVVSADITVTIATPPLHGTAVVNPDKTITYTNDGTDNLADTFTYEVNNSICFSTAKVIIQIVAPDLVAVDDIGQAVNTTAGGTSIVDVLANDTYNDLPVVPAEVLLEFVSSTNAGVTLSGQSVIVAPLVAVGVYQLVYKITKISIPSLVATATVTVTVVADEIIVFDADYAVFTYKFNDGKDLDTRTRVVVPDIGQNTNPKYMGFARLYGFPIQTPEIGPTNIINNYIESAGDNTGFAPAYESIVINLTKIKQDFPNEHLITIDLRGFWYNTTGVLPVNLKGVFYKGGTIIKHDKTTSDPLTKCTFTNPTAEDSVEFTSPDSLVVNNNPANNGNSIIPASSPAETYQYSGLRIATFTYDTSTASGGFDMNDTTTPKV